MIWAALGVSFIAFLSGPVALVLIYLARKILPFASRRAAISASLTVVLFAHSACIFSREVLQFDSPQLEFFFYQLYFVALISGCWNLLNFSHELRGKPVKGLTRGVFAVLAFTTFFLVEVLPWNWSGQSPQGFYPERSLFWSTCFAALSFFWSHLVYGWPAKTDPKQIRVAILSAHLVIVLLFALQITSDLSSALPETMRFPFSSLLFLAVNSLYIVVSLHVLHHTEKETSPSNQPWPFSKDEAKTGASNIAALCQANKLSDRELEVLTFVLAGDGNREIAEALKISTNTVKNHLQNVFRKTGASSRLDLWKMAF